MTRSRLNYWVDIGLFITAVSTFVTGIIKFPGFLRLIGLSPRHLPMDLIMFIHDWGGLAVGILSLVHVILHWKWMVRMTKNLFQKKPEEQERKVG